MSRRRNYFERRTSWIVRGALILLGTVLGLAAATAAVWTGYTAGTRAVHGIYARAEQRAKAEQQQAQKGQRPWM